MRKKIVLILALICAVVVSLTVGTLSSYTTGSDFGVSISPDPQKIRKQSEIRQTEKETFPNSTEVLEIEETK